MSGLNKNDRWYEYAGVHLEWLNPIPNLDVPSYVKQVIDNTKELGADAIIW